MTTSNLTSNIAPHGIGRQQGSFSLRTSTPATGAMNARDAQGQWRVVRGGFIIDRENKILDYQWLGSGTDQVKGRAVDRAGNAGDWETYTFSVAPYSAADWVRYVNTSGNDTTGDGSIGNPWATGAKAVTEAQAALTSGQKGVVFFADDQTHHWTATAYSGSNSTSCILAFVRQGNGANRPIFTFAANVTKFTAGKRGVFAVDGIDIAGADTTDANPAFNLQRSGGVAADQDPWNVYVVDCDVSNCGRGLYVDWGLTSADRDTGGNDFIALQNVSFSGTRWFHVYGLHDTNHTMFRDVEFGTHTAFGSNPFRVFRVGRMFCADVDFATGDGGSMRLSVTPGTTDADAMRECTFVRVTMLGTNAGLNSITIQPDAAMSGNGIVRDVRFVDCGLREAVWKIEADVAGTNGLNATRIDYLECWSCASYFLSVTGSSGSANTITSVRLRNCGVTQMNYAGGAFMLVNGGVSRYAAACFEVHGCWKLWGTGHNDTRYFYAGEGITIAELASIIGASDYNHLGKGDAQTLLWARNGFTSLASWQSATGFDTHSTVNYSTTFDLVNTGATPANADFRLATGTGPLAGTGYPLPLGVAIDAAGKLKSATTPDANPWEYGATATPDDPPLSSPVLSSARQRNGLRLGLRLGL